MTTKTSIAFMFASIVTLCASLALAAPAKAPAPAKDGEMRDVATCSDGKVYRNTTGRHAGACSGHGGVSKWSDGSPVRSKARASSYR